MSNRIRPSNPRQTPGDIAGPGGPHDMGGVVLDARNAILMDGVTVSTVDQYGTSGQSALAMLLEGRINRTQDRARVLFIFGTDGAAGIITEVAALMGRMRAMDADSFLADLIARLTELRDGGNLTPEVPR